MATDKLGLYVHIPYCVRKCNYCDFCSLPNGRGEVPASYLDTLCAEILSYRTEPRRVIDTVYFGGGTPSLLSPAQAERIVIAIRDTFDIRDSAEITLEANPGTLTEEKARAFHSLGFNRVSLGLQSVHENEMKTLGRIHTYAEFVDSFKLLRRVGFDNINVDLMYGIPHQTKESFAATLESVVALSPEHISAYGLILEEGTPLYSMRDSLPIPSTDEECDMYDLCRGMLRDAGYEHYEISNYARAGKRSRHNLIYWSFGEYIGVGAAAHSFSQGVRSYNTDDVASYVSSPEGTRACDTELDLAFEYAMLGLRLIDGFSLSDYKTRFGASFTDGKESLLSRLEVEGLLTVSADRLALTEDGFYVSNSILAEIL